MGRSSGGGRGGRGGGDHGGGGRGGSSGGAQGFGGGEGGVRAQVAVFNSQQGKGAEGVVGVGRTSLRSAAKEGAVAGSSAELGGRTSTSPNKRIDGGGRSKGADAAKPRDAEARGLMSMEEDGIAGDAATAMEASQDDLKNGRKSREPRPSSEDRRTLSPTVVPASTARDTAQLGGEGNNAKVLVALAAAKAMEVDNTQADDGMLLQADAGMVDP